MTQAIVFDFDGVILDSARIKTEAFRVIFAKHTGLIEEITRYHEKNMGISRFVKFRHIYEHILKQPYDVVIEKKLGEEFEAQTYQAILKVPMLRGINDFLKKFHSKIPFFIASGTPEDELKKIVQARQLNLFFREVHGSPATKVEIVADIVRRHSYQPQHMIFVGDADTDRRAAAETGLTFFAVGDARQFTAPVNILTNFNDLEKYIQLN